MHLKTLRTWQPIEQHGANCQRWDSRFGDSDAYLVSPQQCSRKCAKNFKHSTSPLGSPLPSLKSHSCVQTFFGEDPGIPCMDLCSLTSNLLLPPPKWPLGFQ
ncbi:hypothetical protein M758_5G147300 [Ceratodon purpureus]|nr:hypothetical protein M758_5G147300 [Ceratodon purpureus]